MRCKTLTFLIIALSICCQTGFSSENAEENGDIYYKVITKDEREIQGKLIRETEDDITLDTEEMGEITIAKDRIAVKREFSESEFKAAHQTENPLYTRYYFATNAMGLERGKGYYQNAWILFNNVNYGVTDNFSIGAGTIPVFLFGVSAVPAWILPKYTYSISDNFHLGAGAMLGGVFGIGDFDGGGLGYLAGTIGNKNNNLSMGIGWGIGSETDLSRYTVNISGMYRITESSYLITENWTFITPEDESFGIISAGGRWAPGNFALDYGLFRPFPIFDEGSFYAFPWLGVSIPFGGGR